MNQITDSGMKKIMLEYCYFVFSENHILYMRKVIRCFFFFNKFLLGWDQTVQHCWYNIIVFSHDLFVLV